MLSRTYRRGSVSLRTRLLWASALVLVSVAVAGYGVAAQSAGVSGTVFDGTNRVVPGVEVRLVRVGADAEFETESNSAGQFALQVPAGEYVLMFVRPGFRSVERPLTLTSVVEVEPVLEVGEIEETVTVVDDGTDTASRPRLRPVSPPAAPTCGSATTGGVIAPPLKLVDATPAYPASERGTQETIDVQLDATIGRDGFVREMMVVSGPDDAFAASAMEAVRNWQFSPTYLNCQPVEVSMIVRVRFAPE